MSRHSSSKLYVPILITGMLITGSSNSLWSKFQDMQCVENCDSPNPTRHVLYEQPVWQTLQMFLGEMLCFLPILYTYIQSKRSLSVHLPSGEADITGENIENEDDHSDVTKPFVGAAGLAPRRLSGLKVFLLWIPAACDLTGTTLMNVGLLYTPVSIYQMTRGALVLFVGVLSVLFLHRRLRLYQWLALVTVMAGVSVVGLSGSLIRDAMRDAGDGKADFSVRSMLKRLAPPAPNEPIDKPQATTVLVGVFFILFAQCFTATQFVMEENILSRYTVPPLLAVGYEGLFGFISVLILLPLLPLFSQAFIDPSSSVAMWFDLPRGWHQLISTPAVFWSSLAIAVSISLFNFFGLSVTRHVSATARSLTDTCRTLSIWIVSLGLGWERLVWPVSVLQVVGFGLLVYGTFLFNDLVTPPSFLKPAPVPNVIVTQDANEALEEGHEQALEQTALLPADLGTSGYDVKPNQQGSSRR